VLRHRVFYVLQEEEVLSAEQTRLLLSWRYSGFSAHTSVKVQPADRDGLERLAPFLLRPPVSLDRLRVDEDAGSLAYAARRRSTGLGPVQQHPHPLRSPSTTTVLPQFPATGTSPTP